MEGIWDGSRTQKIDEDSFLYCDERGHWGKECPKKVQSDTSTANQAKDRVMGGLTADATGTIRMGDWILDSGATHYMSSQREFLQKVRNYITRISIANGETISASGIGEISITVRKERGDVTPFASKRFYMFLDWVQTTWLL